MAGGSTEVPLALPPLLSPTHDFVPRIRIRHPGYREYGYKSILLELPAVDYVIEPSSQVRIRGLHHGTAIIACGIIANNAFDDVYFSYDPYGLKRVGTPRDGMLTSGDYWLQLTGREPPSDVPSNKENTEATPRDDKYYKYPIVPSFWDWQFPHGGLPSEWRRPHNPPNQLPSNGQGCFLTDLHIRLRECHLIPSTQQEWFSENGMRRYCNISTGTAIDDEANMLSLMANLRVAFDNCLFVIIPKPSAGSSSLSRPLSTSTAEPRPHAFAVHVLSTTPEARDFASLYRNVSIQTKYIKALSPEFLFARFSWALFPYLRGFLESSVCRHLTIIEKDKIDLTNVWMNSRQYKRHQAVRGEGVSESKKRRRSLSSQDGGPDGWKRRSASRERRPFYWEDSDRGRSRHRYMLDEDDANEEGLDFPTPGDTD
ncbi:hypothetical protein GGR51DRAFT_560351 [Nemania sp. FL0031]|nr:hypothetical protein GGR51DRAFT_560351 [Nemania sp. FL0031]